MLWIDAKSELPSAATFSDIQNTSAVHRFLHACLWRSGARPRKRNHLGQVQGCLNIVMSALDICRGFAFTVSCLGSCGRLHATDAVGLGGSIAKASFEKGGLPIRCVVFRIYHSMARLYIITPLKGARSLQLASKVNNN